jgi:tetratricopeptide (TPR) repeat protein
LLGEAAIAAKPNDARPALALWQKGADLEPADADGMIGVADQLHFSGENAASEVVLTEVVRKHPSHLNWVRALGRIALAENDPALAASCWQIVGKFLPQDKWAKFNYGVALLRTRRFEEAQSVLEEVAEIYPEFPSAWRGLGQLAFEQSRHEDSLKHFEKALGLEPKNISNLFDCARQCLLLGNRELGRRYLEEAERLAPGDGRIAEFSARISAMEAEPKPRMTPEPEIKLLVAEAWRSFWQGRDVDARNAAGAALVLEGKSFDALHLMAEVALRGRDFATAEAFFLRANAFDGQHPDVKLGLAKCALEQGRPDHAEALLRELADREPPIAEALVSLARLATQRGDPAAAFAALDRAASLRPGDLWIHNDLGHLAVDLGRLEEAETRFRFVLGRNPNFFHALRGLARVAKARDQLEEGLRHFQAALAVQPEDRWMQWEIASLQLKIGQSDQACVGFRAILETDPDFALAYSGLSQALAALGDAEAALSALALGCERRPDDDGLKLEFAKALLGSRRYEEGRALLTELARGGPVSADASLALYYLLRELGEDREAAAQLERSLTRGADDPNLFVAAAAQALIERRVDEAETIYLQLEARGAVPYWRLVGQANIARMRGAPWRARDLLLQAISLDPMAASAYAELCELVADPDEAAVVNEKLDIWIAAAPMETAPRLQKAKFLGQQGDHAGALAELTGAMVLWPDNVALLIQTAREQEQLGDAEAAGLLLERAARCAPEDPAVLEMLARRAEWRDDLIEARRLMARASRAAPSRRWLRVAAIRLRFLCGAFDEAMQELEETRACVGADPELDYLEVDALKQIGRLEAAAARSQDARARFAENFRLMTQGVTLDADLGRFRKAGRTLQAALPANSRERGMVEFLSGYCAMAQWKFDVARPRIEAAWRANPDNGWILNRLIHCDLMLFDTEAAGRHLRALAQLDYSQNWLRGKSVSFSQTHYGQIYDEFRLDADALDATKLALSHQDTGARLKALRQAVRRFPDYTPASMALLVACRKCGLLSLTPSPRAAEIPARIAQFWDAPDLPSDLREYCGSWLLHNPNFGYERFDSAAVRAALRRARFPDAIRAFRLAEQPAMQADIFRLAHLVEHGGVYADADDCCRASLSPLLNSGASLVLYQEDLGTVGNNFIAAKPRHPVLEMALAHVKQSLNAGAKELLWLSSGPGALTRALCAYFVADEAKWRERLSEILILDRHEMLATVSIHCLASYKATERHWSRTAFQRPASAKSNRTRAQVPAGAGPDRALLAAG